MRLSKNLTAHLVVSGADPGNPAENKFVLRDSSTGDEVVLDCETFARLKIAVGYFDRHLPAPPVTGAHSCPWCDPTAVPPAPGVPV